MIGFITIRILDIIDILLVAFLLYQMYNLIKGTTAINIFIGIFLVYLLWLIVRALNMQLLGTILGQVIGIGVIALIIIFQQEIRRFMLMLGTRYVKKKRFSIEKLFSFGEPENNEINISAIVNASASMSSQKTGAIIVIAHESDLFSIVKTGDIINADTSSRLLESIFFKNSPMHDGAVIIKKDKIAAARCVLPSTDRIDLPPHFGMRHRAALGISEKTDASVVVVSEETGAISFVIHGEIEYNISSNHLQQLLEKEFIIQPE
ncbi:MAG: diadenylate cyclase CdaA [Bacteroidales bacterium]